MSYELSDTWIRQTLRLRGINTEELSESEGVRAKAFVQSHIKEADQIVVRSSRSDKYDRYLADVFVKDGRFLNQMLLDEGLADLWKE